MASLVVFSPNVDRMSEFYRSVLGVTSIERTSGDVRLFREGDEVLIHSVSQHVAEKMKVNVPPEPRESAAIKPIFDVESLELALEAVEANGGVTTHHTFTLNGLVRRDVLDPDGNVIQLRCRIA
jgi:predicted enzyme related to lactoylglutathione lyase